jgi:hypothetical protein
MGRLRFALWGVAQALWRGWRGMWLTWGVVMDGQGYVVVGGVDVVA